MPSPRSEPATPNQLKFISSLMRDKGVPKRTLPQTKHGASELIDRLKGLPDKELPRYEPPAPTEYEINLAELQDHLGLSPQTLRSLVHVLNQVDELGCALFLNQMIQEELPEDHDELLTHILRQFVNEYAP